MSRLESDSFPLHSDNLSESEKFDLSFGDQAAGPQRPFELRREVIEDFDRELRAEREETDLKRGMEIAQALRNADRLFEEKEFAIAEGLYRSVLRLNSDDELAIRGLAQCLRAQDRHEESVKVLKQLVRRFNSAENFVLLADELYDLNYNEEALTAYLNAVRFGSEDPELLFQVYKNIGNLLLRLGDPNGAEEYYNKAYTLNPDSDVLLVNFGSLALFKGDFDKALARFREAVGINDRNDKAWVGLAMIHREYGDSELAWANVEKSIDINPGNESAARLVAEWALKDNEIEKAIVHIEAYLKVHPYDAYMSMTLAKNLYFAGFLNDALLEIEKALDLDPQLDGAMDVRDVIRSEIKTREAK